MSFGRLDLWRSWTSVKYPIKIKSNWYYYQPAFLDTMTNYTLKIIAHWVQNFHIRFFPYSPSFPIKMHATDAKTQKIKPDLIFFWRTKVSEAVCKRDWQCEVVFIFFTCENIGRKYRTQCAVTLSVDFQKYKMGREWFLRFAKAMSTLIFKVKCYFLKWKVKSLHEKWNMLVWQPELSTGDQILVF